MNIKASLFLAYKTIARGSKGTLIMTILIMTLAYVNLIFISSIFGGIVEAINELPEKEKMVLVLYYYEDLTLKEIGQVLNVTESRVSQLHTKANLRLRAKLTNIRKGIL